MAGLFFLWVACSGRATGSGADAGSDGGTDADVDTDSDSSSDTDTESDVPAICDAYCDHEVECDAEVVLEDCLALCACDVAVTLRPDLQEGYFQCMTTGDCSNPDRLGFCREAATEGETPSEAANEFIDACEARPECGIPCFVAILFTDEAIGVLRPCLNESTCELVSACVSGAFSGMCV